MTQARQLFLLTTLCWLSTAAACAMGANHDPDRSLYRAPGADTAPTIDGRGDDPAWQEAQWRTLQHRWLGPEYTEDDFSGRYRVVWTPKRLYVLFDFVDDILIDRYRDPLFRYWDDDTLEIFIDEDHSGGNHQYNHNAFAYHISLDNQAIDIAPDQQPREYNAHAESRWLQQGGRITWEVSIAIYSDQYLDDSHNRPVQLHPGKIMGFMLAYCDNDGSDTRENFISSEHATPPHRDRGWIDAGLFGTLELVQ